MPYRPRRSVIERAAVALGVIRDMDRPQVDGGSTLPGISTASTGGAGAVTNPGAATNLGGAADPGSALTDPGGPTADRAGAAAKLHSYPPPDQWHDVVEHDPAHWPRRDVSRHYRLVPTTCFNCESACGLLAYVDKQTYAIRKFEGNPVHPGSRGRNCAKGPATINQVDDPDRILTPMKRVGERGGGQWAEVSWDDALADIGGRIRAALVEDRRDEIVYHVGRPGSEGFMDRVLRAWGVDGHNSHTNICSSGARFGYAIWCGFDRPSPDYAHADFILAMNAHFESGHYFNPHAQRISEALASGARLAVVDPRLSNTASMAHYWLPTRPGTEAALLLAIARILLEERLYDRVFIERWTNWRDYLRAREPDRPETLDAFIDAMRRMYAMYTPEYAATECGVDPGMIVEVARRVGRAGSRFCSHTWRGASAGHLGGWQVARCLFFLHVLTGSVGTRGGTSPSAWNKYKAHLIHPPPPSDQWNELHWPPEYPLAHYEMSFLLPHFLGEGRGPIDVYFTRVFNPVSTYPDGFLWIDALRDESKIGLHVAMTPTWNETALLADYVLPMGHGPERHDLNTYETHNGTWIAFRQPVARAAMRADGQNVGDTRDANPGRVWEEDEFWVALNWAIDPDGSLGIRRYFESPTDPTRPLSVDEYYGHIFDRVPGLPEAAAAEERTPLEYMRHYGAFEVSSNDYERHERALTDDSMNGALVDEATGVVFMGGTPVGIRIDATAVTGFPTPSRRLEFYSPTLAHWGWEEYAVPGYIRSHIAREPGEHTNDGHAKPPGASSEPVPNARGGALADRAPVDAPTLCLLPTFRLPTLVHTRTGSAKWLNEISQRNPIWIHPSDARTVGVRDGDAVRVCTEIGYFVDRVWITEAIRPGVVACSHHLGRWRRARDPATGRWSGSVVTIRQPGPGRWMMRTVRGPVPFDSPDPDSRRIWWRDGGVPQNLTFPVHPDPISGMHCWHQRVRVEPARPADRTGDVFVDTRKSLAVYRRWLEWTRPDQRPEDLRRPLWLNRPLRPTDAAYRLQR